MVVVRFTSLPIELLNSADYSNMNISDSKFWSNVDDILKKYHAIRTKQEGIEVAIFSESKYYTLFLLAYS